MKRIAGTDKKISFHGINFVKINNVEDYNDLEKMLYKLDENYRCQLMIDIENEIIEAERDKEYFSAITIPIVTIFISVILSCVVALYINASEDASMRLASFTIVCIVAAIVSMVLRLVMKSCMKKRMDRIVFYTTLKRMLEIHFKDLN